MQKTFLWKRVSFAWEWKGIFISMASHLALLWNRGLGQLGPKWLTKLLVWGSLSTNDGDGYENVTYEVISGCFKLNGAYSISFNSSNVDKFFWSLILKDGIEFQEKKCKVVVLCSCSLQSVKLGIFTLYVQWRQRNVQKSVMHVQSCWFAILNLVAFLLSSLTSPWSLLNLPYVVIPPTSRLPRRFS